MPKQSNGLIAKQFLHKAPRRKRYLLYC